MLTITRKMPAAVPAPAADDDNGGDPTSDPPPYTQPRGLGLVGTPFGSTVGGASSPKKKKKAKREAGGTPTGTAVAEPDVGKRARRE